MKKFNYILLAGLALVAAAACNKQLDPVSEPAGIPMTMTATIGAPQTKIEYTDEDNVLKGKWSANEQISVITLDADKKVKTVDTFTTGSESAGMKKATFSGTFTGDVNDEIRVLYPAATETSSGYLVSPTAEGQASGTHVVKIKKGSSACTFDLSGVSQGAEATAHLNKATILSGTATVTDEALSVTLSPLTSVLKVSASNASNINRVDFTAVENMTSGQTYYFNASGRTFNFFPENWLRDIAH